MAKLFVKQGDTVVVIAGKEKGKTAKVLEVSPKDNKVLLDGVNVVTKHQKPRSQQDKGGLIKKNAFMDASNVMVICPSCGKATRVGHKLVDGKNVRVCKHETCGLSLDKDAHKIVKKQAKADKKAENVEQEAKTTKKTTAKKTTTNKTTTKKTSSAKETKAKTTKEVKAPKKSAKKSEEE